MKTYDLRTVLPDWHFDPATVRQLKLLRFFSVDVSQPLTKGVCSGIISRIFSDPTNKHLWAAYVYTTGDEGDESSDLQPHDKAALAAVVIPADWQPKRGPSTPSAARKALEELVSAMIREGSPFDDPLPEITIQGTAFCFTGVFTFGKRKECQNAITSRGGTLTDGVTRKTQVLVIGSDANDRWAHDGYGNKIEDALVLRLQHGKPHVIHELYWRALF